MRTADEIQKEIDDMQPSIIDLATRRGDAKQSLNTQCLIED